MTETSQRKELHFMVSDPRRDALRSELEATRAKFHHFVEAVTRKGWRQKSPSSDWCIGEVLVHLTWALEHLPEEVERARRGQGMFNMPRRLSDMLSYWYIRWIARTATPGSIARRYDQAMDATIALLDTIPEADWKLGANFYGEGFHSVDDLFHVPAQHIAEHTSGLRL